MDQPSRTSVSLIPGHNTEFIVIGHNAYQWLLSIGTDVEGRQYFIPYCVISTIYIFTLHELHSSIR